MDAACETEMCDGMADDDDVASPDCQVMKRGDGSIRAFALIAITAHVGWIEKHVPPHACLLWCLFRRC